MLEVFETKYEELKLTNVAS